MTDTPQDPPNQGAINQADIDALLAGASSADAPKEPVSDGGAEAIGQDDIDALMNAAEGGGEVADTSSPPTEGAEDQVRDDRVDTMGRPFDEMAAAMQAAIEEDQAAAPAAKPQPAAPPPSTSAVDLPDFGDALPPDIDAKRVTMLNDVDLGVKIELGRTKMLIEDVLRLGDGSVVELDKIAGDTVDVFANDRLIARGEVLVLNDTFCVRINEVFSHDPHRIAQ